MRIWAALGLISLSFYGCGSDDGPSSEGATDVGGEGGAGDGDEIPSAGHGGASAGKPSNGGGEGGRTMGESGDAGSGAAPGITVSIDDAETRFLDYGKLRVAFDHDVNVDSLSLELTPARPERLAIAKVEAVDARSVDVTLTYYHLPLDYALRVTGELSDGTPFEAAATLPGAGNGARVAFLSEQSGSGDFSSWEGADNAATALENADRVCQTEAEAAGLRGEFHAFLSVYGVVDAGCRVLGRDATLANHCAEVTTPTDDTPILGLNGLPIVGGADGVLLDAWKTPVSFHADGTAAKPNYVWTGSISGAKGYANDDCTGFTSTTGKGLASIAVGERLFDYDFGRDCSIVGNLMCVQTGDDFFGPSTLHLADGKRAFVSKGKVWGNISYDTKTGIAAADQLCQDEADAAFEDAGEFVAYLGTTENDAVCHVLGEAGQVTSKCGLAELPTTNPWRRVDGYAVGTAAELAAGPLQAPLSMAADGTPMNDERPRTGTDQNGATSWNCGDWLSTGAYSLSGDPRQVSQGWNSHWTTVCDGEQTTLFCFER